MTDLLCELAAVLETRKAVLYERWRAVVCELPGAANLDGPTLRDHIPQFIDEMIAAIARWNKELIVPEGDESPPAHGLQRLAAGFDIKEVVMEYNVLRDAVHELCETAGIQLNAAQRQIINHIIDEAIALAVDTFSREQAVELQRRREEHFAFIAHDLRTPLNAISLTASALAEDLAPDALESADMLRALQRNVKRIDALIRRVMQEEQNVNSMEGLHLARRDIDLWPLVHGMIMDLAPVTEAAKIRITNSVPRHLTVDADAELLGRALQNLVSNAVKFAPGGTIEVGAKEHVGGIECWVRDSGIGIDPARLEKIFDKLETDPDPARAGFGLGLAIFKQIIEAHGGAISVESLPGVGSTFRFTIPPQGSR